VREIIEHALSCPDCGKPLRDFLENRLSKFKEELFKEVSEIAKKKEERRGGLFE
jgi:transcription initiation factor IIE alpha subunit